MDFISSAGLLLGSSFTSGINMYMTMAILGIAQRAHWMNLPGDLQVLGNPLIIGLAIVVYLVEFCADKIPLIDHAWDVAHTFIRPIGGLVIGYLGVSEAGPVAQWAMGLLTGTIALQSHLTKATSRAAVNSTAIPLAGAGASVAEDGLVAMVMYFIIKHPVIAAFLALLLIALSCLLLWALFKFFKKVFQWITGKSRPNPTEPSPPAASS